MNIENLDIAFETLLEAGHAGRLLRRRVGMNSRLAATYRHKLRHRKRIALDTKLKWVTQSGIIVADPLEYSRFDMLELIRFCNRQDTRRGIPLGPEYVLNKFENWKKQNKPNVMRTG